MGLDRDTTFTWYGHSCYEVRTPGNKVILIDPYFAACGKVDFQERSGEIIKEMRTLATKNSEEIREAVEEGKKRMARLAAEGNALVVESTGGGHGVGNS